MQYSDVRNPDLVGASRAFDLALTGERPSLIDECVGIMSSSVIDSTGNSILSSGADSKMMGIELVLSCKH